MIYIIWVIQLIMRIDKFLKIAKVIKCIESKPETYLSLEVLNEIVEKLPRTRIGDSLRHLFKNAFSELIRYDKLEEIPSMETFWRE